MAFVCWNTFCALHFDQIILCAVIDARHPYFIIRYSHFHDATETRRSVWSGIELTHWGRVTHICVAYPTIIASDNGLSPSRRQAIIWANAGTLLIGHLGINFNEILIGFNTFSFKKMLLKISSAKWRLFRLDLNALRVVQSKLVFALESYKHR